MVTDTPAGPERSLAGVKVLVVEDEFVIAADLGRALRELGCVVVGSVGSNREALALVEREHPDVGLLDVKLADGDAGPIARALRSEGVPFAVSTGYTPDAIADPLLRAAPQLTKPYDARKLTRVMRQLLARRGSFVPSAA